MSSPSKPTTANALKYLLWVLLAILAVGSFVLLGPLNRNEKRVAELRTIAAGNPVYPQFIQVRSTAFSKIDSAYVTFTYNVPAYTVSFDDVKLFYTQELTAKGWSPYPMRFEPVIDLGGDREGHVTFRKGNYWITVEPGGKTTEYDVTYRWEDQLF